MFKNLTLCPTIRNPFAKFEAEETAKFNAMTIEQSKAELRREHEAQQKKIDLDNHHSNLKDWFFKGCHQSIRAVNNNEDLEKLIECIPIFGNELGIKCIYQTRIDININDEKDTPRIIDLLRLFHSLSCLIFFRLDEKQYTYKAVREYIGADK